jgi:hypothetical protein
MCEIRRLHLTWVLFGLTQYTHRVVLICIFCNRQPECKDLSSVNYIMARCVPCKSWPQVSRAGNLRTKLLPGQVAVLARVRWPRLPTSRGYDRGRWNVSWRSCRRIPRVHLYVMLAYAAHHWYSLTKAWTPWH